MLLSSIIAGLMACKLGSAADFLVGQKWQIILSNVLDMSSGTLQPADAPVWDIDLFGHDAATIAKVKALGKTVICYFSAGSYEPWRPDANKFTKADQGTAIDGWPDEHWLKTDSANVRSIMTARIQMAAQKGCDAVDPDNTDGYSNVNGLNLTPAMAVDYVKFLAKEATGLGMKIGLKNSQEILPQVQSLMSFAVNEQCAQYGDCTSYSSFLASGKPVFQIEYPPSAPKPSAQDQKNGCSSGGRTAQFSTVLKNLALDGWVMYCDGSTANTAVGNGTGGRIPPNGGFPTGGNGGRPGGRTTSRTTVRTTTSTQRPPTTTSTPRITTTSTPRPPFPPTTTSSPSTSSPTTSSPITSSTPTTSSSPTTSSIPTTSSSSPRPPFPPTTTTPRPPSSTTTSRAPTSTSSAGGGGGAPGCTVAHWNQCGGQDYKGCTTCASGLTCKPVSAPWYYQCL